MKALALVLGFVVGGVAIVAIGTAIHAGAAPVAVSPAPQQVRLVVLDNADRMLGQNLVLHPGPVVLTIVNHANHAHLFAVPGLGVSHVVLPEATTTVRFIVHDGVFHWSCRFPPCADLMNGDIYVSDNPPAPHGSSWATAA